MAGTFPFVGILLGAVLGGLQAWLLRQTLKLFGEGRAAIAAPLMLIKLGLYPLALWAALRRSMVDGIVCGALAATLVIALSVWFLRRKQKEDQRGH